MPQTKTPAHAATGPKRSSAAVPAQGPMMSAKLNVLEYAPMYSPLRPGGARSATYAVDTGKSTISPNVQITTVTVIAAALCTTPSAPNPTENSNTPSMVE